MFLKLSLRFAGQKKTKGCATAVFQKFHRLKRSNLKLPTIDEKKGEIVKYILASARPILKKFSFQKSSHCYPALKYCVYLQYFLWVFFPSKNQCLECGKDVGGKQLTALQVQGWTLPQREGNSLEQISRFGSKIYLRFVLKFCQNKFDDHWN